ncbi:MAG: DUF998 domain-containing protein [Thermoleophilaceae bacterium]
MDTTPKLRARARIALAGPLGFLAGTVAMHFLRDDLDPARRKVSEYATGEWGLVQSFAFLALAAGGFALASCVRAEPGARRPAALLAVFGFGMIAVTLFPADPTSRVGSTAVGEIHGAAAFVAFGALALAMATLARPLVRDGRFGRFAGFIEAMSVLAIVLFLIQPVVPDEVAGSWQRVFLGVLAGWLSTAGLRYLRLARLGP